MSNYALIGNTYDCRDDIKLVGGKFDKNTNSWIVNHEQLNLLKERATNGKWSMQFAKSFARVKVEAI